MKKAGRPGASTVNGKTQLTVQEAKVYQQLLNLVDQAEAIMSIRIGLESMKRGAGRSAEEVFEIIRRKHKIPRLA
jgi:hypothetical protein